MKNLWFKTCCPFSINEGYDTYYKVVTRGQLSHSCNQIYSICCGHHYVPGVNLSSRCERVDPLALTNDEKQNRYIGAGFHVFRSRAVAEKWELRAKNDYIVPVLCHSDDLVGNNDNIAVFIKLTWFVHPENVIKYH